jgi:flagellar motor switch protein FliM
MPHHEILSKDEIDALMEAVTKTKPKGADKPAFLGDAEPYELVSPENLVNGILPVLETIHERFAQRLRVGLFELLKRDVEVVANPITLQSYNDLITSLTAPCSVNIVELSPLRGPGLLAFERQLVFLAVDTFFGGTGRMYCPANARDFTATEIRFIQRLLELTFHCLQSAWQPFIPVHCAQLGAESNPQFVTAINPTETLVLASLQIQRDESSGVLHLALPCSMFEPVRKILMTSLYTEHLQYSERLSGLLQDGLKQSLVIIRCVLTEIDLTVRELLSLKVGDFIPMDMPGKVVLEAEDIPIYSGYYGAAQGWRAFKMDQALVSSERRSLHPEKKDIST